MTKQKLLNTPIGNLIFCVTSNNNVKLNSEIIINKIEPTLPKGMSIEGCIAILLKCSSSNEIKGLSFSCDWEELQEKGYLESGEGLTAWEWESEKTLVMIGTEDSDFLERRLNPQMPDQNIDITMLKNCINIKLETIPKNTKLSLHYIVSWNSLPEKIDSSSWFAVDIPHQEVLNQFGTKY